MLRLKFLVPVLCFSMLSELANAAYFESISLQRPGNGQFVGVDSYSSDMPSNANVTRQLAFENSEILATKTQLFAEISNAPLPYVSTKVAHTAINDTIFGVGSGGAAYASIGYDFFLQGTPNTSLVLNISSIYSSSSSIGAETFSNISFVDTVPNSSNEVSLNVSLTDFAGSTILNYVHNCGGNICGYTYNRFGESFIQPISSKIDGTEISLSNDFVFTEIQPLNGVYGINQLLESMLLVQFGESGTAFGTVSISSASITNSISNASAYIDPFFSIDPAYLELNPNANLSFTPGVGNANPLAAVPAPAAIWLFASGLPVLFGFKRRKNNLAC